MSSHPRGLFRKLLELERASQGQEEKEEYQLRSGQLIQQLTELGGLLESLLGAEPGLAPRLDWLVGGLSGHTHCPELCAWLRRMFSLAASSDKSLLTDVSFFLSLLWPW